MIPRLLPKQRALTLRDDEYRNEEGIVFCKTCNTPRQATATIEGEVYTSRVMCRCQKECYEREEAEEKPDAKGSRLNVTALSVCLILYYKHTPLKMT